MQNPPLAAADNSARGPAEATPPPTPPRKRRRVWPLITGLLALLVLTGAGGAAWASQAGWRTDAPQVLGISPPPGTRNVGGDTPISVAFSQPMNPDSVKAALKIDPPVPGSVAWEGNTLVFHPQAGYGRGITYTVQVGAEASNPLFQRVGTAATTEFKTAGLPSLYRSVPPADARNVPTTTLVTLQFSQPMVALAALDAAKDPGGAVRLQPDAGGKWQWLGSTTLAYRGAALRPATGYTVSVDHSLTDYAGGTLDKDYRFAFTTVRPAVVSTQPEADTKFAGPRDPIVVQFNSPVNHAGAEAGFKLTPNAAGSFAWSADSTVLTYTLSAPLPDDSDVTGVLTGVKPLTGDQAQEKEYRWTFHTSPRPQVSEVKPSDGSTDVPAGNELILTYSAPISNTAAELTAGLRIEPPVKGLNVYSYDNGVTLNLFAPLAPSTQYTLTVGAGAGYRGRDGRPVPAYTWHLRTARTKPDARALSNDGLVSYYAGLPTHVFVSGINVDNFLRLRLWRLSGDELATYLALTPDQRAEYGPKTAIARTWDIPVTYKLDQQFSLQPTVALDDKADRLPPGFYYLRVSTPQTTNSPGTINGTALLVGNTGLIMKQGPGQVWVWAVDMSNGKPQAGRQVRVLAGSAALGTLTTDADGLGSIKADLSQYNGAPIAVLNDGKDAALVASWWNDSIGPWNFDLNFKDRKYNNGQAIYTDRAIYRPGQTIYFKGILRKDDDGRYSLPGGAADITVQDSSGRDIYSATLTLSPFGTFSGQYALPDYAPLGTYYVNCKCDRVGGAAGAAFDVQEYRKPEYLVSVSTDKKSYVNGEQIQATAAAGYLFGGPVAGAQTTVRVLTEDYFFQWDDPDGRGYSFQDPAPVAGRKDSFQGEKRSEITQATDAAGKVSVTLPADVSKAPMSQLETIEASVQDSSNQQVSNNTQVVVHKGQFYIGLRPVSYLGTVGSPVSVAIQTVGSDGKRAPNVAVGLKFYQREWEQTTEKDETGLDRPTWKPKDTLLGDGQATTDGQGHGETRFSPNAAGEYRIVATGKDALGNTIATAGYTYVSAAADAPAIAWQQKNNSVVSLIADKAGYKPGDTAHILVTSPFRQATGLLTVERGTIRTHRIVSLSGPSPVIDLPIDESYLPNVFISLSMVAPPSGNTMPGFRQGYLALPVASDSKALSVTIQPSSTDLHPRDTVTYTLTVRDAAGRPAAAELSLALVDKAIFALADDRTPTLMDSFYGVRSLEFTTASSLLYLADQVASAHTAGGKGGGGGVGAGGVRSQFSDTAYWRGQVTTDANGQATVAVPLPDNLTTWRMTALAVTADTRVGQATNEVVSSKPILLRPRLPRFLVAGDRVEPGVILENRSGCTAEVDVTLAVSNTTLLKDSPAATQRVKLGAETLVTWAATANGAGAALFTFTVGALACNGTNVPGDALQIRLPVKAALTTEEVTTNGAVEPNGTATEHVFLPHGVDPARGGLTLDVAPSLAAGAAQAVDYVQDSDYDSVEATVSRFLPLLRLAKAYSSAGLKTPDADALPGIINRSLVRLYSDQNYNGGWGWYSAVPPDPYITAYVLEGLTAAQAAGYPVDGKAMGNAADYLVNWLNAPPGDARGDGPRLDTRAYVIYVLAQNGRTVLDQARALAVRAPSLALYGRAYLALAFRRLGVADGKALLTDLAGAAKQTTTTVHWEESANRSAAASLDMESDARTSALVVQALLETDPKDPLAAKGVRWLMENRRAGHWLSTQETAAVLGTLAAYMTASGELTGRSGWTATLNGSAWGSAAAGSDAQAPPDTTSLRKGISDLLINQDNTLRITRQGSGGRLYYTLHLSYAQPGAAAVARNEGLSIIREYVTPGSAGQSAPATPLHEVKAGDLVEVRLTIIAPQDAYYLTAADPLPAGLEAVNGTLKTTGLTEHPATPVAPTGQGAGDGGGDKGAVTPANTFFDAVQMRDDKTVLAAAYLPAGVYEYRYLARATTPGTYVGLPAEAHLTYLPDVWGRSDSTTLTVK